MRALIASLGGLLCLASSLGLAESFDCPNVDVRVTCPDQEDTKVVCAAAATAIDFMTEAGHPPTSTIEIVVTDDVEGRPGAPFLSFYDAARKQVVVPTFEACVDMTADRPMFGVETTEELYRSLITHEVAHACAAPHFALPTRVAHEYIAYTAQLATMPRPLRDRVLANYPDFRDVQDEEIDELYLSLSPGHFAVKSYKHFLMADNGFDFFDELLSGAFVPGAKPGY